MPNATYVNASEATLRATSTIGCCKLRQSQERGSRNDENGARTQRQPLLCAATNSRKCSCVWSRAKQSKAKQSKQRLTAFHANRAGVFGVIVNVERARLELRVNVHPQIRPVLRLHEFGRALSNKQGLRMRVPDRRTGRLARSMAVSGTCRSGVTDCEQSSMTLSNRLP